MCAASKNEFMPIELKGLSIESIEHALSDLGLAGPIRPSEIRDLSDIYLAENGSPKIWDHPNHVRAYLNYFLPLNLLRTQAVAQEAHRLGFFNNIEEVLELGSGPGTGQIAIHNFIAHAQWICFEESEKAKRVHLAIADHLKLSAPIFESNLNKSHSNRLGLFIYSLCESELPNWAMDCDSLMIIEPSTQSAGRKLMELRQNLILSGFHIWAPCTHDGLCPLLKHSKLDWCHNRVHWDAPEWFLKNTKSLPMKNDTLTYSYLLAKKSPHNLKSYSRIIGDTLFEKGKTRQGICRGEDREFLSWLKRNGEAQIIPRGSLVDLKANDYEIKGNELRITADQKLAVLPSESRPHKLS